MQFCHLTHKVCVLWEHENLKLTVATTFICSLLWSNLIARNFPKIWHVDFRFNQPSFFLVFPDNFLWLDRDMTQQTFIFALGFYKGLLLQGLNKPCSMAPCTSHRWLFCQRKYFFPGGPKYCEKVSPYFSLSGVENCPNIHFFG